MNFIKSALACALVGAVGSTSAFDVVGSNFTFTGSGVDPVSGKYGQVSANTDTVYFKPGGTGGVDAFSVDASGDSTLQGTGTLAENRSFSVTAASGYVITGLSLKVIGTYFYFTGNNASVSAVGSLQVMPTTAAVGAPTPAFVGYLAENYDAKSWSAQTASIPMSLVSPTSATVRIRLTLGATAAMTAMDPDFNYAFIDARELQLTVMTTPVPEPETYALLLAGLGAVGFVVARRRPRV